MDDQPTTSETSSKPVAEKGWLDRHPKASILLIAAVFYLILFGMCATVFILLLRG